MPRKRRKIHSYSRKYPLYKRHGVKGHEVKAKIEAWGRRKGYSKSRIEKIIGGSIGKAQYYKHHKKHKK